MDNDDEAILDFLAKMGGNSDACAVRTYEMNRRSKTDTDYVIVIKIYDRVSAAEEKSRFTIEAANKFTGMGTSSTPDFVNPAWPTLII